MTELGDRYRGVGGSSRPRRGQGARSERRPPRVSKTSPIARPSCSRPTPSSRERGTSSPPRSRRWRPSRRSSWSRATTSTRPSAIDDPWRARGRAGSRSSAMRSSRARARSSMRFEPSGMPCSPRRRPRRGARLDAGRARLDPTQLETTTDGARRARTELSAVEGRARSGRLDLETTGRTRSGRWPKRPRRGPRSTPSRRSDRMRARRPRRPGSRQRRSSAGWTNTSSAPHALRRGCPNCRSGYRARVPARAHSRARGRQGGARDGEGLN